MGLYGVHASMLQVIFQVEGFEELGTYFTRDFSRFLSAFVIEGDGFTECIHHDAAVLAFRGVAFNFLAEFFVEFPIQVIGQENQQ
jgi:hypothetical protein